MDATEPISIKIGSPEPPRPSKKPMTKDDVKKVAIDLIKMHGQTTSLGVKEELRNQDFWAGQAEVSDFLNQISKELKWKRVYANGHYTYTSDDANKWWGDEEEKDDEEPLVP